MLLKIGKDSIRSRISWYLLPSSSPSPSVLTLRNTVAPLPRPQTPQIEETQNPPSTTNSRRPRLVIRLTYRFARPSSYSPFISDEDLNSS